MISPMSRQCQLRPNVVRAGVAVLVVLAQPTAAREYFLEFGAGPPGQSGYLQTPDGGMPGTASSERPTLDEIDLDGGSYRWLGVRVDFRRGVDGANREPRPRHRLRFQMRYTAVGDEATTVLDDAFTIRGGAFGVGDSVGSRVSFDNLTLSLGAVFDLTPGLSAQLGGEIGWTAFDFTMMGEHHRSERAYHVNTVGVAGALDRDFGNGWHLGTRLAASPAVEGTGSRYTAEARLRRDLSKHVRVALGASMEHFRYDDAHKQALPNRLKVRRRVVPTVSVRLRL